MKSVCVTISLNEEEQKILEERIEKLKKERGTSRISKAEAIRSAIIELSMREEKT